MPASIKVVDTSAIAALLFGEPRAEDVARRLGTGQLVVPTLLRYELSSVCLKKIGRYPAKQRTLIEALSLLDKLGLKEVTVVHEEVVELAARTKLTTYDASYLWLARTLEAEVVTLDEDLQRAALG